MQLEDLESSMRAGMGKLEKEMSDVKRHRTEDQIGKGLAAFGKMGDLKSLLIG